MEIIDPDFTCVDVTDGSVYIMDKVMMTGLLQYKSQDAFGLDAE